MSLTAFVIDGLTAGAIPGLSPLLQILGLVPCGLTWLFARALFRPQASREIWPRLLVASLFISCLAVDLDGSGTRTGVIGYIWQVQHLIGSGMLVMIAVEALDGINRDQEHLLFRLCFAGGYLAIVAASLVADLPENADWTGLLRVGMASTALILGTLAFQYRRTLGWAGDHIRTAQTGRTEPIRARRDSDPAADQALARTIAQRLVDDALYLNPDLKVADLAARLRVPDYKVSQAITGAMGYANFNQLINAHRIADARARLADPGQADRSILEIAMACGFGSLGPFNRAFKAITGLTPSAYRRRECPAQATP